MLKAMLVALACGAGIGGAYLIGREHHQNPAVAPDSTASELQPKAPAPAQPPSGPTLESVLEGARVARLQQPEAPKTSAERRQAIENQLSAGDPTLRRNALRALSLDDRPAAETAARQRLNDPALFADCARLLLVNGKAAPASRDVADVRKGLRTLQLDEPSRVSVSTLVLETLVRLRSPAAPPFAATLLRSPSEGVRAATPKVMISMPEEQQVPLLLGALGDQSLPVRQAARAELTYVARKDLGDNPAAWTQWWKTRARKPAR
jgi:hypothetical protein